LLLKQSDLVFQHELAAFKSPNLKLVLVVIVHQTCDYIVQVPVFDLQGFQLQANRRYLFVIELRGHNPILLAGWKPPHGNMRIATGLIFT
jgi:hypothetical protein